MANGNSNDREFIGFRISRADFERLEAIKDAANETRQDAAARLLHEAMDAREAKPVTARKPRSGGLVGTALFE